MTNIFVWVCPKYFTEHTLLKEILLVIWKINLTGHTKVSFAKTDNTIWKGPHQCFLTLNLRSESKGQDGGGTSKKRLKGSAWDVKIIHWRRKLLKSPSSLLSCLDHISLLCSSQGNQPLCCSWFSLPKISNQPQKGHTCLQEELPFPWYPYAEEWL